MKPTRAHSVGVFEFLPAYSPVMYLEIPANGQNS